MGSKFDGRNKYDFKVEPWISRFHLDSMDNLHHDGLTIVGPADVISLEGLRSRLGLDSLHEGRTPTDVFVLNKGEPQYRGVTKIGGVPLRPADEPWPVASDGRPATFLAQFRFRESHDIIGETPDELLLVFVNDHRLYPGIAPDALSFEWRSTQCLNPIQAPAIPKPAWTFVTCYGSRFRTSDLNCLFTIEEIVQILPQRLKEVPYSDQLAEGVARVRGLKIGGLSTSRNSIAQSTEQGIASTDRFLCSLTSIGPASNTNYPWLNHECALTTAESFAEDQSLDFCDGFVLEFFLSATGTINWTFLLR